LIAKTTNIALTTNTVNPIGILRVNHSILAIPTNPPPIISDGIKNAFHPIAFNTNPIVINKYERTSFQDIILLIFYE
jgi:hypothetical protein